MGNPRTSPQSQVALRPFGYQAWGLAVDGRAAAVVVSGSTVSAYYVRSPSKATDLCATAPLPAALGQDAPHRFPWGV